jgi:hypothetical protein
MIGHFQFSLLFDFYMVVRPWYRGRCEWLVVVYLLLWQMTLIFGYPRGLVGNLAVRNSYYHETSFLMLTCLAAASRRLVIFQARHAYARLQQVSRETRRNSFFRQQSSGSSRGCQGFGF